MLIFHSFITVHFIIFFLLIVFLIIRLLLSTITHVKFECDRVVTDGQIKLADRVVATTTVEVCIRVVRVDFYHACEVTNGLLIQGQSFEGDTSVVQGVNVFRV